MRNAAAASGGGTGPDARGAVPATWTGTPRSSTVLESSTSKRRRQPVELGRAGERVARDRDVVIPEHDEGVEARERLVELSRAPAAARAGRR